MKSGRRKDLLLARGAHSTLEDFPGKSVKAGRVYTPMIGPCQPEALPSLPM